MMKLVGKAVRDYSVYQEDQEVTCIGIASWGYIRNNKILIKTRQPGWNQFFEVIKFYLS